MIASESTAALSLGRSLREKYVHSPNSSAIAAATVAPATTNGMEERDGFLPRRFSIAEAPLAGGVRKISASPESSASATGGAAFGESFFASSWS